jgi:hypothetical protein
MEQRCKIILQNYIYNQVYNTDYEIINNFIIKHGSITLFHVFSKTNYIKYNICNKIQKGYCHNKHLYYFNNKNCIICFYKK